MLGSPGRPQEEPVGPLAVLTCATGQCHRGGPRNSCGFFFPPQQKTSWLILKGDADSRTNSPDLDSQSLSHSSGTDRDPLQTMQGDNFYSREWFF